MRNWIKHNEITEGGDIGGDYQVTEAWEARWSLDGAGLRLITVYAYGEVLPADRAAYDEGVHPELLCLTAQVEYLICSDPNDPGGSETFSDARYFSPSRGISANRAEHWAKVWVAELTADGEFSRIFAWDGHDQKTIPASDSWAV